MNGSPGDRSVETTLRCAVCTGSSQRSGRWEHLDRAAERGMKRTKSFPEEGGHEQAATTEWMDEDSEFGRDQSSGGSGSAGTGVIDRKRKVEAEHPEDVEREYDEPSVAEGTQMTAEDNEEDEEARRRKTVIF